MENPDPVPQQPRPPRPIVAIVGRPNVGKSTLFNRIAGKRLAIVEDVPGVTRDRNYAEADWEGRPFTIVDTGGFLAETEDQLMRRVREQARLAIDEAHTVVLVVDGMTGPNAADQELAALLRKSGKALFLAVNKIDSARREEEEYFADFFRLGIADTFAVSAEHGRGIGELLDRVVASFPPVPAEVSERDPACRVAIVGRPNVGKSSLINRLLGEERFVASEVPGTTTDPLDARIEFKGKPYVLTDTAGLRRKRSIALKVEQFSVMRALSTIDRADVVVLVMDA
ncbi:MAG: ribosome biogenesis GTPase Der, partial [Deltaproteobacteria bacterium]|nr:ribosome biogenesis GTPase Der [Deltaproteobacteria bacterium]